MDAAEKMTLVVDIELTCDDPPFPATSMEIIEIGAVLLSPSFDVVNTFQSYIKPARNSQLSEFCKRLTNIRQSDIDGAPSFLPAMLRFNDFLGRAGLHWWAGWGQSDADLIIEECRRNSMLSYLELVEYINLKYVFAKSRKMKQVGLRKAMELSGMELEGKPHSALNDAVNAAKLAKIMAPLLGWKI